MSSSSNEDLSKFSEATDVKLFNNSLFAEDKGESNANAPVKSSMRYLDTPNENRVDLKVTPGFQKHVASRLMKIIDSSLDQDSVVTEQTSTPQHDSNGNCTTEISPKEPEGGIKLFGASAAFLLSCNIVPPQPTRRRKRGRRVACISSESEDDSSSNEADISNLLNKESPEKMRKLGVHDEIDLSNRFAACAVSSEWILNGEAVKGWALPYKNKEPIQGEATPDLIKMTSTSFLTNKSVKHEKKRKHKEKRLSTAGIEKTEVAEVPKRRGKRGCRKCKKKMGQKVGDVGEAESHEQTVDNPISEKSKKKKKRREKRREIIERMIYKNLIPQGKINPNKLSKEIYKHFKRSLCEDVNGEGSNSGSLLDNPSKKKKKKKHSELGKQSELMESLSKINENGEGSNSGSLLDNPLKKKKKQDKIHKCLFHMKQREEMMRKQRKEGENELPMPLLEDSKQSELKESLSKIDVNGEGSNSGSLLDNPLKKKKKQGKIHKCSFHMKQREKMKKQRKERENELPMPLLEDEGFDSDPTKADRERRQQRKLLKAHVKKQRESEKKLLKAQFKKQRKSGKKLEKKIEYLSKDLANLMMTNV